MAVTIVVKKIFQAGNSLRRIVDVTGPVSYTTGGEALTAAQLEQVFPEIGGNPANDWSKILLFDSETNPARQQLVLDKTNNKMLFLVGGAEVANLTNLSAVTIRAELILALGGTG